MNELLSRVKRLEQRADEGKDKEVAFAWIEENETEAQAEARWRRENPGKGEGVSLYCVSWADESTMPPQHSQPEPGVAAVSIDAQIQQIVNELEGEGFSLEQIAEMVQEESPEQAPQHEEAKATNEEQTSKEPEPLKARELVRLFSKRRR